VPLWGVGQRIFFLHDGRTNDLLQAILAHAAPENGQGNQNNQGNQNGSYSPSEATAIIQNFRQLSVSDQQSILDFLRSL
jgi:CxxC motif-containing protein (DUF1111 family)